MQEHNKNTTRTQQEHKKNTRRTQQEHNMLTQTMDPLSNQAPSPAIPHHAIVEEPDLRHFHRHDQGWSTTVSVRSSFHWPVSSLIQNFSASSRKMVAFVGDVLGSGGKSHLMSALSSDELALRSTLALPTFFKSGKSAKNPFTRLICVFMNTSWR